MSDSVRTGASLARGQSKQDYATPRKFLDAVQRRFGTIVFDLAAHADNCVVPGYFGPGGILQDALSPECVWQRCPSGSLWLNPPFDTIAPWARKCAEVGGFTQSRCRSVGQRILFLVPASVGSEWFAQYVDGEALVVFLRPRLSFDGKNPYPKDCMLCVFGAQPGYECWRWC